MLRYGCAFTAGGTWIYAANTVEEFRAIFVNVRQKISKICRTKEVFVFVKCPTLGFDLSRFSGYEGRALCFSLRKDPVLRENPGLGAPSSCLTACDVFFFMDASSRFLNLLWTPQATLAASSQQDFMACEEYHRVVFGACCLQAACPPAPRACWQWSKSALGLRSPGSPSVPGGPWEVTRSPGALRGPWGQSGAELPGRGRSGHAGVRSRGCSGL